jgi:hypothetical protein
MTPLYFASPHFQKGDESVGRIICEILGTISRYCNPPGDAHVTLSDIEAGSLVNEAKKLYNIPSILYYTVFHISIIDIRKGHPRSSPSDTISLAWENKRQSFNQQLNITCAQANNIFSYLSTFYSFQHYMHPTASTICIAKKGITTHSSKMERYLEVLYV